MADTSCDGAVELGTTYQGAAVSRRAECQKQRGHAGSCSSQIGLISVFGKQIRVAVDWDGPSPAGAPPAAPEPPPRPGPWGGLRPEEPGHACAGCPHDDPRPPTQD